MAVSNNTIVTEYTTAIVASLSASSQNPTKCSRSVEDEAGRKSLWSSTGCHYRLREFEKVIADDTQQTEPNRHSDCE
jgi:hypothetical protein